MKIAMIDLETTGLDPTKHEIIEIGCVLFEDRFFQVLDTFETKVRPRHIETASKQALTVNGYTPEAWKDAMKLGQALHELLTKTEDAMFCAHNMIFDYAFINATGVFDGFDRHKIDLFTLAWAKIPHDKVSSWSLKTICSYLNIPPEPKIHRAINGAMTEFAVYKKLMQMP